MGRRRPYSIHHYKETMDTTINYQELKDLVAELEQYEYLANGRLVIADKYRALLAKERPVVASRPRVGNY